MLDKAPLDGCEVKTLNEEGVNEHILWVFHDAVLNEGGTEASNSKENMQSRQNLGKYTTRKLLSLYKKTSIWINTNRKQSSQMFLKLKQYETVSSRGVSIGWK